MTDNIRIIRRSLAEAADPVTKEKVSRLVSGAKAIGVTVPKLRQLAADFRRNHAELTLENACELMDMLCRNRCREEILFGIFFLGRYGKAIASLEWKWVEKWIDALDNWETCDQLASIVGGPMVAAHLHYIDNLVKLAKSNNLWKRRFAAATVSEINHKGRVYPKETFRVCSLLLSDPEPMVWKAVGWAIREITKKDEATAYRFLQENRKRISSSLLREASKKLLLQHRQKLLGS